MYINRVASTCAHHCRHCTLTNLDYTLISLDIDFNKFVFFRREIGLGNFPITPSPNMKKFKFPPANILLIKGRVERVTYTKILHTSSYDSRWGMSSK